MPYNISESSTWTTNVRGVSTTDPVLGGSTGQANYSAKDLTDRTKWLKDKLAAVAVASTWTEEQFTADDTWVVPAGVTQILVKAKGAGGGGSGAWTTAGGALHPGGGGGEGAEVDWVPLTVTPGWTLTIDVGAGGAGGTGISTSDTYAASVLGSDGAATKVKHNTDVLVSCGGGKGGGIASGNGDGPGADVMAGQGLGGLGGSATVDGITYRGAPGGDSDITPGKLAGNGGGQGGGQGGATLNSASRSASAGVCGGGGGGGIAGGNGAAGGDGYVRIAYIANAVTGNT